ncbi:polymer-forming cytoskeletal protein [Thermodesulfobacteriota bacterium]
MGIFNKYKQPASGHANTTIIAAGTKIKGEFQGDSIVQVDGKLLGNIDSNSLIVIGETGLIEGEIVSKKLIISGRLLGSAYCDEIEIKAGGKVIGQIACDVLMIERGSFFEGESKPKERTVRSPGDSAVVEIHGKSKTANAG